jgi:hypothetical protein
VKVRPELHADRGAARALRRTPRFLPPTPKNQTRARLPCGASGPESHPSFIEVFDQATVRHGNGEVARAWEDQAALTAWTSRRDSSLGGACPRCPRCAATQTPQIVINWRFPDTKESAASTLSHGALTAVLSKEAGNADATVTIPRAVFEPVILGQRGIAETIRQGDATVTGNSANVISLFGLFDDFDAAFPIVEPRR